MEPLVDAGPRDIWVDNYSILEYSIIDFHILQPMKTKAPTEFVLLGALYPGSKHGYEILQFLDSALGTTWRVSTSQLYALLKRLGRGGFVRSGVRLQEARPSKRVFSLTPSGEKAFLEWLHRPIEHVRELRMEFMAKLFFFHYLSLEGAIQLIETQIRTLRQIRKGLQKRKAEETDPYHTLGLGIKLMTVNTWLRWLPKEAAPFFEKADLNDRPI
jgi:DNA-binding PadR family transcriptional regulator